MKIALKPLLVILAAALATPAFAAGNTLIGWAMLPAATFADGPTSGQFAAANPYGTHLPPYADLQPVQGFSAVLAGPEKDTFLVMTDNGFGAQANSADTLLRMYALKPDFKTASGGTGKVSAVNFTLGTELGRFSGPSRITLNDANQKLGVTIQADLDNYYNDPSKPAVDPDIKFGRLLTGADFDIESVRRDKNCNLWFGDEFGPYLVKTDTSGTVLRSEISLPGVYAPQHKDVIAGSAIANLGSSGGFEGMAINRRGDKLYTLLEKTVTGDMAKTLRINEFDIDDEAYTGVSYVYPLDSEGNAIGDMTAIDDHRFLVIERNGDTATSGTPFKKIFIVDIQDVASDGTLRKSEWVDLMNIADPDDLNGDGKTTFTFPYVTIEDLLILDAQTLLVINDNNFPYGGGRELTSDNTELLKIRLAKPISGLGHHRHAHGKVSANRCEAREEHHDRR
ncbi:esterase-like activity of phytase family protein [Nitrosospira sp. NpAV]|uniref:esterase-like activity of phytase family protein n=1 Tax=Nitrosospira sp. NpAV TaxID=58133 RepID=UPI000A023DC5|nr:esterase-like activity of phytase family protein [Nitrosospira sp. NpAV]